MIFNLKEGKARKTLSPHAVTPGEVNKQIFI